MLKKNLIIALLPIAIISCKKEGNKNVIKKDSTITTEVLADNGEVDHNINYNVDINGNKTIKTDYIYKATDGTLVKVKFNYDKSNNTITITNNNKTFILDKVKSDGKETVYEKDGMNINIKGDSLILKQGNNVIELVKTKI